MNSAGTVFDLHASNKFNEIFITAGCLVLTGAFSAFCMVAFIRKNIKKVIIELIAMDTLQNKIPVIYLTSAQTYRNVTSNPFHYV